jgi:hypothetical protein
VQGANGEYTVAQRTRAERRHENQRILSKRYRQDSERTVRAEHISDNHNAWRYLNRSKYGNSIVALTLQERAALYHLQEQK